MFRSTLIISLIAAAANGISFLNQLVLARIFGAGIEMDSYLLASSLPLTLIGLFVGILSCQLIPALIRAEKLDGNSDLLHNSLLWVLGGSATIFAFLCAIGSDWIIGILNPRLSVSQHVLTTDLARVTWLCFPLAVLGAIYTAGLHVRLRFTVSTAVASFPMIGALICCLLAHARMGILAVAFGQLIGYCVMVGGLRLALGASHPGQDWVGIKRIITELPYTAAALLVFVIYPFSDAYWGTRIGPAAISYLGYAQRILVGFSGLVVIGATTVLFPRLAQQASDDDVDMLRKDLAMTLRIILVCMAPVATILAMLALPVMQILFQRGAFYLQDARALAEILPPMLTGMVAMSCMGLIFKALFTLNALRAAAALSLIGSVMYFLLSGLLGWRLGLMGIGLAYAFSWWLVLLLSLRHIWRSTPFRIILQPNLGFAARLVCANIIVAALCWLGRSWLQSTTSGDQIDRLCVIIGTSVMAMIAYLLVGNTLLHLEELRMITRKFFNLVK